MRHFTEVCYQAWCSVMDTFDLRVLRKVVSHTVHPATLWYSDAAIALKFVFFHFTLPCGFMDTLIFTTRHTHLQCIDIFFLSYLYVYRAVWFPSIVEVVHGFGQPIFYILSDGWTSRKRYDQLHYHFVIQRTCKVGTYCLLERIWVKLLVATALIWCSHRARCAQSTLYRLPKHPCYSVRSVLVVRKQRKSVVLRRSDSLWSWRWSRRQFKGAFLISGRDVFVFGNVTRAGRLTCSIRQFDYERLDLVGFDAKNLIKWARHEVHWNFFARCIEDWLTCSGWVERLFPVSLNKGQLIFVQRNLCVCKDRKESTVKT